jgi:hypothetical protein
MSTPPWFQAGLPPLMPDVDGIYQRYSFQKGVVRGIDPDRWRVDIEAERGGLLHSALVIGDVLPPVHVDTTCPSHVVFTQMEGNIQDLICWPLPFRRFFGKETSDDGHDRHFYDRNLQALRVGNLVIRINADDEIWLFDAESDDYLVYKMQERTLHAIMPHVIVGTEAANRVELHTDTSEDRLRVVIPKAFLGRLAVQDTDGISYTADQLLHLVSTNEVRATASVLVHLIAPIIKFTASQSIILDPPHIYLGNANATERVVLGDLFAALYNSLVTMVNTHVHSGVQVGAGTTGTPTTAANGMSDVHLSDIARVSKTGL